MPAMSKNKERRHLAQVRPILDKWWGEEFVNVPASGALRWGGKGGHWTYADLVPPESFPFVVECKWHIEVDVDEILRKDWDQGRITWFWYDCTIKATLRATEELGRHLHPMLIYRMNKMPNRLVLDLKFFNKLTAIIPHLACHPERGSPFAIMDLKKFVDRVSRTDLEKIL